MRQIQRKACRLRAVCVLDTITFDGAITDISTVGMFIKTERSFPAGKPIRISCRLPGWNGVILSGEFLSQARPTGIGIRLKALTPQAGPGDPGLHHWQRAKRIGPAQLRAFLIRSSALRFLASPEPPPLR